MSATPWVGDFVELGQGQRVDPVKGSRWPMGDAISMAGSLSGDLTTRTGNMVFGAKSSCNSDGRQAHWLSRLIASFDDYKRPTFCETRRGHRHVMMF
jgi:hypothetical protein